MKFIKLFLILFLLVALDIQTLARKVKSKNHKHNKHNRVHHKTHAKLFDQFFNIFKTISASRLGHFMKGFFMGFFPEIKEKLKKLMNEPEIDNKKTESYLEEYVKQTVRKIFKTCIPQMMIKIKEKLENTQAVKSIRLLVPVALQTRLEDACKNPDKDKISKLTTELQDTLLEKFVNEDLEKVKANSKERTSAIILAGELLDQMNGVVKHKEGSTWTEWNSWKSWFESLLTPAKADACQIWGNYQDRIYNFSFKSLASGISSAFDYGVNHCISEAVFADIIRKIKKLDQGFTHLKEAEGKDKVIVFFREFLVSILELLGVDVAKYERQTETEIVNFLLRSIHQYLLQYSKSVIQITGEFIKIFYEFKKLITTATDSDEWYEEAGKLFTKLVINLFKTNKLITFAEIRK